MGPAIFRRALAVVGVLSLAATHTASAEYFEIGFRSFSGAAAIGPPAVAYADKLANVTETALGPGEIVQFTQISPRPPIPPEFSGDIVAAVAAGAAGGGFDAAYSSGDGLNATWGFLYNSAPPFFPGFAEYLGFLYGKHIRFQGESISGTELLQKVLDKRARNVVVLPIVGSSAQGSGYFPPSRR